MDKLKIKGTETTPKINYNQTKNELLIEGKSISSQSLDFYQPVISWLQDNNFNDSLHVKLRMDYLNTSSAKCFLRIFKQLEKIQSTDIDVQIFWYYEEEDANMQRAGENYASIIDLPFKILEK